MIPVPPVVLRGPAGILGRVSRTATPRAGELVNLPAAGFGEGRLLFRVRERERWHTASAAPPPGGRLTLSSGDIVVRLDPQPDEKALHPLRAGASYFLNGVSLGGPVRTAEGEAGDFLSLEIHGPRRRFKVAGVERIFDDMALHGDGVSVIYQQTDVICHLTELQL